MNSVECFNDGNFKKIPKTTQHWMGGTFYYRKCNVCGMEEATTNKEEYDKSKDSECVVCRIRVQRNSDKNPKTFHNNPDLDKFLYDTEETRETANETNFSRKKK